MLQELFPPQSGIRRRTPSPRRFRASFEDIDVEVAGDGRPMTTVGRRSNAVYDDVLASLERRLQGVIGARVDDAECPRGGWGRFNNDCEAGIRGHSKVEGEASSDTGRLVIERYSHSIAT